MYAPDIEAILGPSAFPPFPSDGTESPPSVRPSAGGGIQVTTAYPGARGFPGGAFDGASRFDSAIALWAPALRSADYDILPEKPTIDARVRDSIRNDAYVAGGAALHRDSIVGNMYLLNAKPTIRILGKGFDETWESEFQEEVETKFTLWAESPENWVDASRRNTLTSMVRLAVGIYVAAGEVLSTVEWLRDGGASRPFNTAIQMIELDRLDTPPEQVSNLNVRGGILHNQFGAPQTAYIRLAHPTDFMDPDSQKWKAVPFRKPWGRLQVIHILEQTRADQSRGISEMVSALKELRITKKFRDIVLQNAVINATYAASIESEMPSEVVFQALGGKDDSAMFDALTGYAESYLGSIAEYTKGGRNLQIDGVKIPHLYPGTKLQLRPAGQGGPLGTDFEQSLLRYIAANLGVSYEELSRDYSHTNYSSGQLAKVNTGKFMRSRKRMVADRYASAIYRLWFEEALNKGQIDSMPRNAPSFYEGQNADAYTHCDWIGASVGQVDELKETQAAVLRIKFGISTREDEMARLGKDWRTVLRQVSRERAVQDDLGLNFDQVQDNAASGTPADTGKAPNGEGA